MVETKTTCPYFGGITQQGKKHFIKCGKDSYVFETQEQANDKALKCENQMEDCRPFLFRKLEEMGAGPTSEWSTEELRTEYLKITGKPEGGKQMSEITTTTEGVKPLRSHVVIAAEINSIKDQVRKIVLINAIEIGRRLVEAKEVVAHGEWANWLKDEVDFSQSTANNMMRLFEEFGSNQTALFDDNLKSQTFGNLSYSQAVKLLAIPEEEREEFIQEHNVENLSVRELDKVIKEKQELEERLKNTNNTVNQIAEERDKLREEKGNLESNVRVTDQVLRETQDTVKQLQDKLEETRNDAKAEKERLARLLEEAKASGNTEEADSLQTSIDEAEKELKSALDKIAELERLLKEKPIEAPVTTTIEVVPEDIQKELNELREKAKQAEAQTVQQKAILKFGVCFEALVKGFNDLLGSMGEITDPEDKEKYKTAVKGLIGKMTERLT